MEDMKSKFFIKGFTDASAKNDVVKDPSKFDGRFITLVTNLIKTVGISTLEAKKIDSKWHIVTSDGMEFSFEEEPDEVRELRFGEIVRMRSGEIIEYNVQPEKLVIRLSEGSDEYHLRGWIAPRKEIITSSIKEVWVEIPDIVHVITKNKTHYVF